MSGTTLIATSSEASSESATVMANGRKILPMTPVTRPSGRNTATVVSVDVVIAEATSLVALRTSSALGVSPRWRCRKMFSMTTIESSTTRPMATVRPPSVMTFKVTSVCLRKTIAIMIESGIDTAAMMVARQLRRNSMMTTTANRAPSRPSRSMPLTEALMPVLAS